MNNICLWFCDIESKHVEGGSMFDQHKANPLHSNFQLG